MPLTSVLADYPQAYWLFVYAGWGGAYAAITLCVGVMALLTQHWTRQYPDRKALLFLCQLLWAVPSLAGVFVIPWLLGALALGELREPKYLPVMVLTWAVGTAAVALLVRPFWRQISSSSEKT